MNQQMAEPQYSWYGRIVTAREERDLSASHYAAMIRGAVASGMSAASVARAAGVSRQRVYQIINEGQRLEDLAARHRALGSMEEADAMTETLTKDLHGLWRCQWCGLGFDNHATARAHVRHAHTITQKDVDAAWRSAHRKPAN